MKLKASLLSLFLTFSLIGAEPTNLRLFVLAGQSNMAGRGMVDPATNKSHPNIFMLNKEGKWVPAVHPIHYDKSVAGVGLGMSFAKELVKENPDMKIGLIPTACGGSSISTWKPGGYHGQTKSHPYDDAIKRIRTALKSGKLEGILWHQGESDSNPARSAKHEEELTQLIQRFRTELKASELPFIIGQLGQFSQRPWNEDRMVVDFAQRKVAIRDPKVAFVKSDGLQCKSDNVHFDTPSLIEFGKRYAEAYKAVR